MSFAGGRSHGVHPVSEMSQKADELARSPQRVDRALIVHRLDKADTAEGIESIRPVADLDFNAAGASRQSKPVTIDFECAW